MSRPMTVCVVGSINEDVVARVATLPRPGETVTAREVTRFQGGKGANQAVAAARLGATVRLLGMVGHDAAGNALLAELAAAGVEVGTVRRMGGVPTGAAYITIAQDGENQIVVVPGANARLVAGEEERAVASAARVVLAQLETPVRTTAALFDAAPRACRILNTAPALDEAAGLFEATDLLVLNQTELAFYLRLADQPSDPAAAAAAARLLTREGQAAIVTLGSAGAVLVERGAWHHVPGLPVAVVDTTGAGDCLCGALAALIAEGRSPRDALAFANAAAAFAVQRPGAGPAMPFRHEVEAWLRATESAPTIKTHGAHAIGSPDHATEKGRQ